VAEAATIAESTPTLSEVTVFTGKVAQSVRLSAEQYGRVDAASLLTDIVRRAVTNSTHTAHLSQVAPTGPAVTAPARLWNVAGITKGGAVATTLDRIVDARMSIAVAGGNATHIIASPAAGVGVVVQAEDGDGFRLSIIGRSAADPLTGQLLGIPVLVTSAMKAGSLIVIDRWAVVSAVGPVVVAVSDQAYFASDSIGLRCTFRFGQRGSS
jgi:HK97 family phage major capsid protein